MCRCLEDRICSITITITIIMVSGPGRCPGGAARYLVSACLLSVLLYLPEARASYYPTSGECKGKGKDCTGKRTAAAWLCCAAVGVRTMHPAQKPLQTGEKPSAFYMRVTNLQLLQLCRINQCFFMSYNLHVGVCVLLRVYSDLCIIMRSLIIVALICSQMSPVLIGLISFQLSER